MSNGEGSQSDKQQHEHAPANPERIRQYQTRYRMALAGYGYDDSEERRAFLKLMEGKEYGDGPLMSAWAWFREGRGSVAASETALRTCEWLQDEDGIWHTGCGQAWTFTDSGTPKDHGAQFCYHCGGALKAEQFKEESIDG